jgi:hypothetical protein
MRRADPLRRCSDYARRLTTTYALFQAPALPAYAIDWLAALYALVRQQSLDALALCRACEVAVPGECP